MTSDATNLWTIKEGIQDTLRADTTVVSAFRRDTIQIGLPSSAKFSGLRYPCLFITNDRKLETLKPWSAPEGTAINVFKHYISFKIYILAHEKNAQKVEESLDLLQKYVIDALNNAYQLGISSVEEAIVTQVENFPVGLLQGQPLDGRVITLQVIEVS